MKTLTAPNTVLISRSPRFQKWKRPGAFYDHGIFAITDISPCDSGQLIYFWFWELKESDFFYYPTSFWPDYATFLKWYQPQLDSYRYHSSDGFDHIAGGKFYNNNLRFPFAKIPENDWASFISSH